MGWRTARIAKEFLLERLMANCNLLKLPDHLEGNLQVLLHTPQPDDTLASRRKALPKPSGRPKPKPKRR
jgi:hypothetical protein